MYKRVKSFFYISILALFLVGCGEPGKEETPAVLTQSPTIEAEATSTPKAEVTARPELTERPTVTPCGTISSVPTEGGIPSPTERPTPLPEPTKIPSPEDPVVVGEDGILLDNELCKVQLISFEKEESDYVLRFLVENRSERHLVFSADDVYVNRLQNSFLEVAVPPGETVEEKVMLFSVEKELGITKMEEITEILIPLAIYDERQVTYETIWSGRGNAPWLEEWSLCDCNCVIYPQGAEAAKPFYYEREPDDVVVEDNEYFTLLLIDEVYEEGGGYTAKVFVENHTGAPLFLEMEECSLNGFRCDPYWSWETYLQGNTKGFGAIYWYGERLEESEGDLVEKIDFTLYARGTDLFSEERYQVYPKGEDSFKGYSYIPEEQDVMLYEGPECMLALTDFTTKMRNWDEKMLVATAYFVNKSEVEMSFRIEGTEQVYMGDGITDEWNEIPADLWSKDVGVGEKRKVVLYLAEEPADNRAVWTEEFSVCIGKERGEFFQGYVEVTVPMEVFQATASPNEALTPTPALSVSVTPTVTPTSSLVPTATSTPSPAPTATPSPTPLPTATPTPVPTKAPTAAELIADMKIGWNLGNTMDSIGETETIWGQPMTTQEMIDAVAAAGFNTIRIPTTWYCRADENFVIREDWLARVKEVVDYCYANDMYVILNTHHETEWMLPTADEIDEVEEKFVTLWEQIAAYFKEYDEHLIFEGMNEPRIIGGEKEWDGGTEEGREMITRLNNAFMETVRASGGKNGTRCLLITSFAASSAKVAMEALDVHNDPYVGVSIHAYTPYRFTFYNDDVWDVKEWTKDLEYEIDYLCRVIDEVLVSKGVPVVITEFGAQNKTGKPGGENNLAARCSWVSYYVKKAGEYGIPCIYWDNGNYNDSGECFGLLNRKEAVWYEPEYIEAMVKAAE